MPQHASHIHGAFSWADLPTRDLPASQAFYAGLFGWTYKDMPIGEGMVDSMCLKDGVSVCAMTKVFPPMVAPQNWLSCIPFASFR